MIRKLKVKLNIVNFFEVVLTFLYYVMIIVTEDFITLLLYYLFYTCIKECLLSHVLNCFLKCTLEAGDSAGGSGRLIIHF